MPCLTWMQHPAIGIGDQQLFRRIFECDLAALLRIGDLGRIPGAEEPVIVLRVLPLNAPDRLAKSHSLANGFGSQCHTARTVHHGGGNLVGSNDRIKRRGRRMHHERLVEASMLDGVPPVANVDE